MRKPIVSSRSNPKELDVQWGQWRIYQLVPLATSPVVRHVVDVLMHADVTL